jgi:hypothetical protein
MRCANRRSAPTATLAISLIAAAASALAPPSAIGGEAQQIIPDIIISSTIPANGDLNPYGVAFVPPGFPSGKNISPGDILVSNFNDITNTQGTGTTIISLTPNRRVAPAVPAGTEPGNATIFFQGSGLGLTTALGVLRRGFVLVGNVPTSGGMIQSGSLLFLDRNGNQLSNSPYTNALVNDPWDMTIVDDFDHVTVFVSNVNSTTMPQKNGSVTRLNLMVSSAGVSVIGTPTVIADGYTVEPNDAALVLGPTGLAYDPITDTLYVASTADNAIFSVPHAGRRTGSAGTGNIIFQDDHLRGPLALVLAPNGDLITSNGDAVNPDPTHPSEIVEFTKSGKFVGQFNVDAGQGGAFGIGITTVGSDASRLAAVDDNANDIIVIDQNPEPRD